MQTALILILSISCCLAKSEHNCSSYAKSCRECIAVPECGWDNGGEVRGPSGSYCVFAAKLRKKRLKNIDYPKSTLKIITRLPQHLELTLSLHKPLFVKMGDAVQIPERWDNIQVEHTRHENGTITAKFEAISCPEDTKKWTQNVVLPFSGSKQTLRLQITLICSCICEEGDPEPGMQELWDQIICNSRGQHLCGQCKCDKGYFGENCQCKGTEAPDCTRQGAECSGRGRCVCGECSCNKGTNNGEAIWGKYCECDNFSCERYNELPCGGPERGECNCGGECHCLYGWSGSACQTTI